MERRSRLRLGLGAAVVLVLVAAAVGVLVAALSPGGATRVLDAAPAAPDASGPPATEDSDTQATGPPVVLVHLLGAVERPGLYELRAGDRAVDAVAAAGGLTADADPAALNLARPLVDGEQIIVPRLGEAAPSGSADGSSGGGAAPSDGGGLVNLNTADAAALDTLPGVGPATAQRILDWREQNGRFTAVDDLLSVSGIGPKTFAEIEPLVTV